MDIKEHTTPEKLEYYSFLWSEVRLVIAAVALFIGGTPPILLLVPVASLYGLMYLGLKLAWIVSGVAAAYLAYRWYEGGQKLFGGKDTKDTVAFLVSVVSGINLGLVGFLGQNIGMSLVSGQLVFLLTGAVYLAAAGYLYMRWNAHGKKLF